MVPTVVVKQLTCGVAILVALGVILPPPAEGQDTLAPVLAQGLNPIVRPIAPPASQPVPPGQCVDVAQ